jgi:hypothetical protein
MEPVDESRAKFERDMIQMLKAKPFDDNSIQVTTWAVGDLRKLRDPVKRKGSASTAAATSNAPSAPRRQGRAQPPNLDGAIASVSVKKERAK